MTILSETDSWPTNQLSGDPASAIDVIVIAVGRWKETNLEPPTHVAIPIEFKRTITKQLEDGWSVNIPRGAPDEIAGLKVIWSTGDGCTMELLRA